MAVLLGVFVAMSFGSADFFGGRASRTAPTLTVLLVGQVVAVTGALVIARRRVVGLVVALLFAGAVLLGWLTALVMG